MASQTFKKEGLAVVLLSGGLDSMIALVYALENYVDEAVCLTFDYGQKQSIEIQCAQKVAEALNCRWIREEIPMIKHRMADSSANIVGSKTEVPKAEEVLGDPQPVTYVPNRNMIMLSLAISYAEAIGAEKVVAGLQQHDTYGYFDTTPQFLEKVNDVIRLNRKNRIEVLSPFIGKSKRDELLWLMKAKGNLSLCGLTMTCYNPGYNLRNEAYQSCQECASCKERQKAFADIGQEDRQMQIVCKL